MFLLKCFIIPNHYKGLKCTCHFNFPIWTVQLHMLKGADQKYHQNSAHYIPVLGSMDLQSNFSLQKFQSPNCCLQG